MRIIKYTFTTLFLLILSALLLVWLLSPWLVRSQGNPVLSDFGYALDEQSTVRLNPFTLKLSLDNISVRGVETNIEHARIDRGHLDISLLGLLSKQIRVESFLLDGPKFIVEHKQNELSIAGYPIPLDKSEEQQAPVEKDAEPLSTDWQLIVDQFDLANLVIPLVTEKQNHEFKLDSLSLADIQLDLGSQTGDLGVDAQFDKVELTSNIAFDFSGNPSEKLPNGKLSSDIELRIGSLGSFNYLIEEHASLKDSEITIRLEQAIELNEGILSINSNAAELNISKVSIDSKPASASLDSLALVLPELFVELDLNSAALTQLSGKATLTGKNIVASEPNSKNLIAQLGQLDLGFTSFSLDQNYALQYDNSGITLTDFIFSAPDQGTETVLPPIVSVEELVLGQSKGTEKSLALSSISLGPVVANILIAEDKGIKNLVQIGGEEAEELASEQEPASNQSEAEQSIAEQEIEKDVQTEPTFLVSLEEFDIRAPSHIHIEDQSVRPRFNQSITIDQAQVGGLSMLAPNEPTPFELKAHLDEYAKIETKGKLTPFTDKLNLNIETTLREFSLPQVSPYVRDAAGFDMLAGQFDLDLNTEIIENEIEGETVLKIRGIEIETGGDVKTGSVSESSFIPLNLALGALKDSDGNIKLEVPLSGNTEDPDFGLNGFFLLISQKAALVAAETAALNTLVPYANVVSLAKVAGSYALKVRVDNLEYAPKQIDLSGNPSEKQTQFLTGFTALLQEKPKLQAKICAFSTLEDLPETLAPDLKSAPTLDALKSIAKNRADQFKSLIVSSSDIASSRLLVCQPQIDGADDGKPRIEFDLF